MAVRRNVVIVLTHGLRADALGDGAAWPLRTPGFEKLAERGLSLVATSACPADPGGMVSLLTGLHARQHGRVDTLRSPPPCAGWPALLREAGYYLCGVGLVGPIEACLHEAVRVEPPDVLESGRCAYLRSADGRGHLAAIQGQRRQRLRFGPFEPDRLLLEPDDDIDGFIASEAVRRLDAMPATRPWALIVAFSGPGNDLPPPMLYEDLVEADGLGHDFAPPDFRCLDTLAELDHPRVLLQRLEPHKIGRIRADYLSRVSLIDHGVARLAAEAQRRPDAGHTWTIAASDRGCLLGEHGLVGHRSFLCPAVEVPVIVAPPPTLPGGRALGSEETRIHDGLVSVVDVAATIAALAGCDLPRACAGRSLLPALAGEPVLPALAGGCLSEFGHRLMLETERHKLVYDTEARRALGLYDLLNDPAEARNLIDGAAGKNLIDALRWRLCDALLPLRAAV